VFLIDGTKLILGCVVARNPQYCVGDSVSFLQLTEIIGEKNGVTDITSFYLLNKNLNFNELC
jgi:hypothetical protein